MERCTEAFSSFVQMRVLHISTADYKGGASIAAYRIHKAISSFCMDKIDSRMLVRDKQKCEDGIHQISIVQRWRARLNTKLTRLVLRLIERSEEYVSLGILGCGISRTINELEPDVVHIHWVQGEMLAIRDIQKIKAPVITTMHDMWPVCGIRHYDGSSLFRETKLTRMIERRLIAMKKRYMWSGMSVHFTTKWMADEAKRRGFEANQSFIIPYPGEINAFFPTSRSRGSIITILFGAQGGIQDKRKGFSLLDRALIELWREGVIFRLEVFGCNQPKGFMRTYTTVFHGVVNDQRKLRDIYGHADVMVVPSLAEAFGQTATESIACGTPVITFKDIGTSSLVEDGETGFIVREKSYAALKQTIRQALEDTGKLEEMRSECREYAIKNWGEKKVALEYAGMYKEILRNAKT